jgi:hypothetical protein
MLNKEKQVKLVFNCSFIYLFIDNKVTVVLQREEKKHTVNKMQHSPLQNFRPLGLYQCNAISYVKSFEKQNSVEAGWTLRSLLCFRFPSSGPISCVLFTVFFLPSGGQQ